MADSKEKKKIKLKASNGDVVEVSLLGQDYFGRYEGKELWCPIYSFEALNWLVKEMQFAVAHTWDQVSLLTGREGCGKSALGLHIGRGLNPDLSLEQIAFTQEQFKTLVAEAKPGDTVIMDEAAEAMFAHEWMERGQRDLVKAFLTFRAKRLQTILILPHQMLLNKQLRERRVYWWFDVYAKALDNRGYAQVRKAPLRENPWRTDIFWDGKFTLRFPSFDSVDKRFWDEYEKFKLEFLDRRLREGHKGRYERASDSKLKIIRSCKKLADAGWSINQIAQHYEYEARTIKDYLKRGESIGA